MVFVSVLCTFLITKLCTKLPTNKELDMSSLKAKREVQKAAAAAESFFSRRRRH
jgi:hypothetical protein